jgi:hypothetical protein
MIRDYRYGLHEARSTFGNIKAGQRLADVERHLTDATGKAGLCGVIADAYATYSWLATAQRITKAPICQTCHTAGQEQEASLKM